MTVPDPVTCNHPMYCKYELIGLEYSDWDKYVNIIRNFDRERVIVEHFKSPTNYSLTNKTFATYPDERVITTIPNITNSIEIKNLGFDRALDWCTLFVEANEIHTVETSFCYILTLLGCKNVFVYPRHDQKEDFNYVRNIYPKIWNFFKLQDA